ncbi:hypothetical protein [Catellatospora tritici]|uniref:hypothetical protein n=1 Tax=Catellatospora tritici TaxID=2851566 RepID=UPI001C2D3441|nr:hypothetical protein [Catellatospora tritici]MBV1854890.1 hypothetical protein [Catellatospora tritici]
MFGRAILVHTLLTGAAVGTASPAAAADTSVPGSYAVGYVDASVSASGRSFSARIYYPATTAGQNAAVATGRFPAIAFGHGFLRSVSKYYGTMPHLASWGFVVVRRRVGHRRPRRPAGAVRSRGLTGRASRAAAPSGGGPLRPNGAARVRPFGYGRPT